MFCKIHRVGDGSGWARKLENGLIFFLQSWVHMTLVYWPFFEYKIELYIYYEREREREREREIDRELEIVASKTRF